MDMGACRDHSEALRMVPIREGQGVGVNSQQPFGIFPKTHPI